MFPPTTVFARVFCVGWISSILLLQLLRSSPAYAEETSQLIPVAGVTDSSRIEFFESRIRPVLIEHCYECHSNETDEVGGSLWLDSADAMATGGDSGPAIRPGDSDGSLLISAIRYDSSEMPPSGRLPDHIIQDFEKWIRDGAVDPRDVDQASRVRTAPTGVDVEQGRQFWAFQPVRTDQFLGGNPRSTTVHSRIDAFLNEELANAGLVANDHASVDSQLRRLAFDLTGLPPDEILIQQWRADPTDRHWAKIVDRLLASPGYAEHWARHEMDVARYADSNGADFNATHHDAWRYRDYLVRSIANDLPVDEMIRQQIAGDLLPFDSPQERHDQLVATTFLMLGTKMLSERDKAKLTMDVVDEQVDTVGRAFMGMTLGCARCHDHKFDPIPTEDYYALAGIFRSTRSLHGESQEYVSTWTPTPLPASPALIASHRLHEGQMAELNKAIAAIQSELNDLKTERPPLEGIVLDDVEAVQEGTWSSSTYVPGFIGEGYLHDNNRDKGDRAITFQTTLPSPDNDACFANPTWEVRLWYAPGSTRAKDIPATIRIGEQSHEITFTEQTPGREVTFLALGQWEANYESDVQVRISNQGTTGYVIVDALQIKLVDDGKRTAQSSEQEEKAAARRAQLNERRLSLQAKLKRLEAEMASLKQQAPEPLPHAMAVADRAADECGDCQVHIRGEVNNLGDVVPRGFLRVCGSGPSTIGAESSSNSGSTVQSSGRVELADWLTDPDHPLTSRVAVNRIWMHLMGEGIVRTVDNFGSRGERPTHPELLDSLAIEFVRGHWSRKHLIRKIVKTDAYRRSSQLSQKAQEIDPENRLWWRAHRRRLPAEAIRDSMLVISGAIDRSSRSEPMKGMGVLVSNNNANSTATMTVGLDDPKRTIYLPVVRGEVPTLLATLDAADPDLLVGKRTTTNVPSQALALIGSDEVRQWATMTVQRLTRQSRLAVNDTDSLVESVYINVLQRSARPSDRVLVDAWLNSPTAKRMDDDQSRWREWIAALFAGTEFRFLD